MKLKENDKIPNSEIFVLENGEPAKKNIEELLKNKKASNFWSYQGPIHQFVQLNIYQAM